MKSLRIAAVAAALTAAAGPAFAHVGVDATGGLAHGFMHPISGLDHVLAMVSVGLFASRLGGRALWAVPAAFVGLMVVGGALGHVGAGLPYVEPVIALSVICMGALLALDIRLPVAAATALAGAFALFHGHAHGTEGAHLAGFAGYAIGFVAATMALHLTGIALGFGLGKTGMRVSRLGRSAAGLVGCIAGTMLLAG